MQRIGDGLAISADTEACLVRQLKIGELEHELAVTERRISLLNDSLPFTNRIRIVSAEISPKPKITSFAICSKTRPARLNWRLLRSCAAPPRCRYSWKRRRCRNGTGISFAGQRNLNNSFVVDGLSANDDAADLTGTFFSQDVIREFQVVTSGGIAEFGRASGGVVNIVTQSGNNDWAGRLYGFARNQRFDARNPLASRKDPLTQLQYGASISGPLRRDHTFLFTNFEQTRRNDSAVITIAPANVLAINNRLDQIGYRGPHIETGVVPGGFILSQGSAKQGQPSRFSDPAMLVSCGTVNGSASSRCDFTTASGTLSFAAGETTKSFKVLINQDPYVEGPETFPLSLSNLTAGAVFAAPAMAMVTITDDVSEPAANPIDDAGNFVREHYHDFLNREGDSSGQAFWTSRITVCGADAACIERQRIGVSAQFFMEQEFQQTGSYVYRTYKGALGRRPTYLEFVADRGQLQATPNLDAEKFTYSLQFVQRPEFTSKYSGATTANTFVDALIQNVQINSGIDLTPRRDELLAAYNSGSNQRLGII
jgi:hypothetical protein